MCRYSSQCPNCRDDIKIKTVQENMNDVNINIASSCPGLDFLANKTIKLDAIHELVVPKDKTVFYHILTQNNNDKDCIIYDEVIEAIGRNLGRYYGIV